MVKPCRPGARAQGGFGELANFKDTPSIFYKHQSISTNSETRQIFEKKLAPD